MTRKNEMNKTTEAKATVTEATVTEAKATEATVTATESKATVSTIPPELKRLADVTDHVVYVRKVNVDKQEVTSRMFLPDLRPVIDLDYFQRGLTLVNYVCLLGSLDEAEYKTKIAINNSASVKESLKLRDKLTNIKDARELVHKSFYPDGNIPDSETMDAEIAILEKDKFLMLCACALGIKKTVSFNIKPLMNEINKHKDCHDMTKEEKERMRDEVQKLFDQFQCDDSTGKYIPWKMTANITDAKEVIRYAYQGHKLEKDGVFRKSYAKDSSIVQEILKMVVAKLQAKQECLNIK